MITPRFPLRDPCNEASKVLPPQLPTAGHYSATFIWDLVLN